jgi:hypothetical protein
MVSGFSARAEKRKALSGGSGFTWPCADSATVSARHNANLDHIMLGSGRGFGRNPFEIGGQAMGNGDSDYLR